MIEGMRVTVSGNELRDLCRARSAFHSQRVVTYQEQIENMQSNQVEGMNYTNGDPVQALMSRKKSHQSECDELLFIADHLLMDETYLLESQDLVKLGITSSKY